MKSQDCQVRGPSGYGAGPPWLFTGRALYQLHLVKADVAKKFIPADLKLVQAFGYTLGGMYLAHYDSSPAGAFDELVVIAGTVWNPPTSCAWAAKVLVSSLDARDHGRKEVGLPSHFASFSPSVKTFQKQQQWPWWNPFSRFRFGRSLWQRVGMQGHNQCGFDIMELDGSFRKPLCHIGLPENWRRSESQEQWHGPSLAMSLPSFSGKTQHQPQLLKYSCQLSCSVKFVEPATIITTHAAAVNEGGKTGSQDMSSDSILSLLTAKPLLAMSFERMLMHVEAPIVVSPKNSKSKESHKSSSELAWNVPMLAKTS